MNTGSSSVKSHLLGNVRKSYRGWIWLLASIAFVVGVFLGGQVLGGSAGDGVGKRQVVAEQIALPQVLPDLSTPSTDRSILVGDERVMGSAGTAERLYRPPKDLLHGFGRPPFDRIDAQLSPPAQGAMVPATSFEVDLRQLPPIQVDIPALVSDGQFVWGPNQDDFDASDYLQSIESPLAEHANHIELWTRYTSVSPRVLLVVLEMRYSLLSPPALEMTGEEIRSKIESTAMDLSLAFYEHLYTAGSRRTGGEPMSPAAQNISLETGRLIRLPMGVSSGSYAIAAVLAAGADFQAFTAQMSPEASTGFPEVFGGMFPEVDLLDASNEINPDELPADDFFQFPFPLGARWYASGAHSWHGGSFPPPYSSLDFFIGSGTCEDPPKSFSVAAAGGSGYHPSDYQCWYEIDHGGGWTTSYYHLSGVIDNGSVHRNQSVGRIDCRICAGGFATGPHVHFSLKYNGAYVSLEGVKLSGWTVHVGNEPYDSGSLERDGVILTPYSLVQNDYHSYYPDLDHALRFHGNGEPDVDRVKISLDNPYRPVDAGETDFTLEWWMMASTAENEAGPCLEDVRTWREGNIIFDRDVYGPGDYGEYGVSLANGRIAFGVQVGHEAAMVCGEKNVADGYWHHVAVTRDVLDGRLTIFVDGILDAQSLGPPGDISYRNRRSTEYPNDPFLVIGAEKHDLGEGYSSYSGWIDEVRLSDSIRYSTTFVPPSAPFVADSATLALFPYDEGEGDFINDISGNPGAPSNGTRMFGGTSIPGPEWSLITPFGPSFVDVPGDYWASDAIEAIFAAALTKGCDNLPPAYCPENSVSRAEMAVFLERGLHGSDYEPPEPHGGVFADVPASHWAGGWIEQLYADGITSGCSVDPFRYCPDQDISRAEMAVFLERVKNYPYLDPPPAGGGTTFDDVGADHWAVDWIEQLYVDGITEGCSIDPLRYCPESLVTRAEMAVLLARLLNLSP